jgi:hypothetical protein
LERRLQGRYVSLEAFQPFLEAFQLIRYIDERVLTFKLRPPELWAFEGVLAAASRRRLPYAEVAWNHSAAKKRRK